MHINIVHNSYRYLIQACYVYYKRDAYNLLLLWQFWDIIRKILGKIILETVIA